MTRDLWTQPPAVVVDVDADAIAQMRTIEARVQKLDADALVARWEFGRVLLAERQRNGGKQLPHGRLAEVCADVGITQAEARNRIQFASEHSSREEVATAVATFGSWTAIREQLGERGHPRTDCTPDEARALTDRLRVNLADVTAACAALPPEVVARLLTELVPVAEQVVAGSVARDTPGLSWLVPEGRDFDGWPDEVFTVTVALFLEAALEGLGVGR